MANKCAKLAAEKVEVREKCRTDKFYLSKVLGFDFQEDVHTDLFANYVTFKPDTPLDEQSPFKNRMVLWSRGFFKTTSIIIEIVQLILNYPNIRILLMQGTVPKTKDLLKSIKSHFDGTNMNSKLFEYFPEFCQMDKKLGTAFTFTVPNRTKTLPDGTVTVASPENH